MLRRRPIARMAVGTAVVAGTAGAVARRTSNNANQQAAAAQQAAAPAPQAEDPYEQLKKLGDLHAQGILTDEEFAAQKAKLLG
jgi:membrane protease subunit (stomatin/prohibitin family)